ASAFTIDQSEILKSRKSSANPSQPSSMIPSSLRADLAPGLILGGHFKILQKRGMGGMAEVWRAWDMELNRDVAIKIPLPDLDTKSFLRRFEVEKQVTAQLDPRYVATVYGTVELPPAPGRKRGVRVPVMEYVDGQDLSEIFMNLPLSRRLDIFAKVCEGILHAHRKGFV